MRRRTPACSGFRASSSMLPFQTAREIRDAVAARQGLGRRRVRRSAGPHRRGQPVAERLSHRGRGPSARLGARGRPRQAIGASRRRSDRRERQHHDARYHDHRRVTHARDIRATLRRDRRKQARIGRRRHHGEDQLRRVRDGIVHRELGVRPFTQPVEPRSHLGRIEWRLGRGRGGRHVPDCPRLRHRRIHQTAGFTLRHRRLEADLRARIALRVDCVCVFT